MERGTLDNFIKKGSVIHGNKYDYSKSVYINNRTKLCIICPKHGEFWQKPNAHIDSKQGCPKCWAERRKTGVFGYGTNDLINMEDDRSYAYWHSMLNRCYSEYGLKNNPAYKRKGCSVCEEWLLFSNFKRWFDENYREGYDLDKDILVKGNTIYSPETCCFVPKSINRMLINRKSARGKYPVGISYKERTKKYYASISIKCKRKHLGTFDSLEEAFNTYKEAKENWIKNTATEYFEKSLIDEKVYNALMKYEVEITD